MTDAFCDQIQSNITSLAAQIKADGIYVMVLAIDAAQSCTILQGENVADAGGYFSAPSYADLQLKALAYVEDIIDAGCANSTPKFDLNITLNSYTASNCVGNTGTYKVDYTINNIGTLAWSNPITISFYDGDPTLPTTHYITKQSLGTQNIAPNGNITGSFTSTLLIPYSQVFAIVNFDGSLPANAPPLPTNLKDKLLIAGERRGTNNISNGISKMNDFSCTPKPVIQVNVSATNIGCDNTVNYAAELCNTGDAEATIDSLIPIKPHPNFTLKNQTNIADSTARRIWGTYYGGGGGDYSSAISTDEQGNIFMAGATGSTNGIATSGSHQSTNGGKSDVFLVKFNSAGVRQWGTYYGGSDEEEATAISIDSQGNVYMAGKTSSFNAIGTSGSHQSTNGGKSDAFLVKFNSAGVHQWGTYYGGIGDDFASAISIDAQGNIYMVGNTGSDNAIATTGSHQSNIDGTYNPFLVKFNSAGVRQWGTYYGGSNTDANSISTDKQGNIYILGYTRFSFANAIATVGSHQASIGGEMDAFLVKFNSEGVRQWGTYYGGSDYDFGNAVYADAQGNVFMAGYTQSTNAISTPNGHQASYGGDGFYDAFLVKFNGAGLRQWGTYYGGIGADIASAISIDVLGNVYMAGFTANTTAIATDGSHQESFGGGIGDAFLVKLNSAGVRQWGTYYGGSNYDDANALATDEQGNIYLAGITKSVNAIATPNSHQPVYVIASSNDGFLVKFSNSSFITFAPGECKTIQYTYTYNNVPPGTYDFSVGVATSQIPIIILPDSNFTAGGIPNLDGFNGAVHTSDNITITGNTPACPTGDQVKVAVSIPAVSGCGSGNYAQAIVTITNTSGVTIFNPSLYLNLTGTGSKFGGELYNLTNNLKIPSPNLLSPNYPNVPYALYGKTGEQRLPIWELPNGTSTFQVDIDLGTTLTNLAVRIDTIPTVFNDSGKSNLATDAQGVSVPALPSINGFTCPSAITAGGNITFTGISTTNTTSLKWSSSTQANIPNGGTLSNPSLVYTPSGLDLANGYVAISLTVYNSAGCEVTRSCQIAINSVLVDYGDAPITYDLNKNTKPIAGSATLLTGIHLGSTAPSTESIAKNTTTALGDGGVLEEDGLIVATCGAKPVNGINYPLTVKATNNTTTKAYVNAFADWNNDGDYLDEGETAIKLLEAPISSGTKNYILNFKPVSPNTTITQYFVRLRISTDSNSIKQPYETAPSGEVEDHLMKTGQILSQTSYSICQGDTIKINGVNYSSAGTFSDTLTSSGGCDSIITLTIKVNLKYARTQNVSICPGKSYTIGIHTYTQAGTYKDTLKTVSNCDSIITTILSISTAPTAPVISITQPTCTVPTGAITITAVSGNTYSFDGGAYSTTLIYSGLAQNSNHTIKAKNASGCESTLTNASIGTAPSAPSAPVISITQPTCTVPTGTITITAVSGNTYSFDGGAYSATLIYSGLAQNSNHTIKAKNAAGCESTATNASIGTAPTAPTAPVVNITQPTCTVPTATITITAVAGNTYSFDGGAYSTTLIYSGLAPNSNHTIKAKNASSCESAVTNVSINAAPQIPTAPTVTITQPTCTVPTGTITITAVAGNAYSFDGSAYSAMLVYSGLAPNSNHTVKAKNASSCESTATNTSIKAIPPTPNPVAQNISICPSGSYTIGNHSYTQAGIYKDTLRSLSNCDSIVTTTITVSAFQNITRVYSICKGNSIIVGTHTYTQTGNYTDTLSGLGGCDTIQITQLTVNPTYSKTNKVEICQGESIQVGNKIYTQTGVYIDTLKTIKGCDSIIISDLTVNPTFIKNQSINLCEGESIQIGIHTYNQTGIYRDTFKTIHGCDSILISDIKIRLKYIKNISAEICPNGSYTVGNQIYTQAGNYIDTLKTVLYGCDSIINLNLSVKDTITKNISATICGGDSIKVGDNYYHETGIYNTMIRTNNGCDSLVILDLTVKPLATSTIDTSICWNKNIVIGNQTYNTSGNYSIKIPRQGDCDSIVQLNLTVFTAPNFDVKVDSQLVYVGSTVQLSVEPILQDVDYEWTPSVSNPNSPTTTAVVNTDTWFYVNITTDLGCVKTDSILIEIRKTACDVDEIYLPNAFTPNGDKKNDVYFVRSNVDFDEMKLMIFDRWGELVFETTDQNIGWDGIVNGRPALVDTYGYILEAKCSEETITRKGKIVLIR